MNLHGAFPALSLQSWKADRILGSFSGGMPCFPNFPNRHPILPIPSDRNAENNPYGVRSSQPIQTVGSVQS
jgi:hypothetical protein